jgi:hypothetical protein
MLTSDGDPPQQEGVHPLALPFAIPEYFSLTIPWILSLESFIIADHLKEWEDKPSLHFRYCNGMQAQRYKGT